MERITRAKNIIQLKTQGDVPALRRFAENTCKACIYIAQCRPSKAVIPEGMLVRGALVEPAADGFNHCVFSRLADAPLNVEKVNS